MAAIDKIKDQDKALDYVNMSQHGIVKVLTEIHTELNSIYERTEDPVTKYVIESIMLKVEAQLNY
jgi:hypothetical protein